MLADFINNTSVAVDVLDNITIDIQVRLQSEIVSVKNIMMPHRVLKPDHDKLDDLVQENRNDRDHVFEELNKENWDLSWLLF